MKTLAITTLTALLSAALMVPTIGNSYAAISTVEDGKTKLTPKSFGPKTTTFVCNDGKCTDNNAMKKTSFDGIKKEEVKAYLKAVEKFKAMKFAEQYYKNYNKSWL